VQTLGVTISISS